MPPSLKNIFKEVWHDYPLRLTPKPTLESWAKQGVFLLNITLTVAHGRFKQPRQHWVERRSGHEFQRGVGMLHFFPGCVMDSFVIL
jgi:uracil DNA glycosylase